MTQCNQGDSPGRSVALAFAAALRFDQPFGPILVLVLLGAAALVRLSLDATGFSRW